MPTKTQSVAQQHATWLSLIEISGPFLSMPVLEKYFPSGLDAKQNEDEVRRQAGLAYEEWADNQGSNQPEPALHQQWLRFVLEEVLEIDPSCMMEGQHLPERLTYRVPEYGEILRPLLVVGEPGKDEPRLLVQLYPANQNLEKPLPEKIWKYSPAARMAELLRHTDTRLGLITNGKHWMLIDASREATTGYYTWDASLWSEEKLTLQAFRCLLGMGRFFSVPPNERLEALLAESALKQEEVTTQLGEQVRRAIETLVRTLDRLDKDSQRALLGSIAEKVLYEAALTVMMRLVFLLSAEEREMLLLGDPLYEENYAVSTIHKQLRDQADQQGEEVLGLRYDAWSRLLAVFRLVFGGSDHQDLNLPAYGGRLFDPDRFPFLEGRQMGTNWREEPAQPLKIDNRTVLHLLDALQYLRVRIGGVNEKRRLSFRGLDIEQIGHVYEGLLDHTARRSTTAILGLLGSEEPETTLEELETKQRQPEAVLLNWLETLTSQKEPRLRKALNVTLDDQRERRNLLDACENKQALFERVLPFAGLLRKDTFGNFLIVTPGSIYITHGSDRRSTGTHYTPRSLTEPLVQHALDPLVYIGPAEGLPQEQWQLRSASEILDLKICDLAMGSGAFLVQTCRYLSEKLVEAWDTIERAAGQHEAPAPNGEGTQSTRGETAELWEDEANESEEEATPTQHLPRIAPIGQPSRARQSEELLSRDIDERLATARRIVAERCLYGVDKNPMAVEMAKLSLWLITLAKNKPFTFLDSNLRCGDSLLGVNLQQLKTLAMDEKDIRQMSFMEQAMEKAIILAMSKRREISMRLEQTAADAEAKALKQAEADKAMQLLKLGGDLLIGIALADSKRRANLRGTLLYNYELLIAAAEDTREHPLTKQGQRELEQNIDKLRAEAKELLNGRTPFHWPLEFPEVFAGGGDEAGFAVIVGNPPFMGGKKITGVLGTDYRDYLLQYLANGRTGHADLCAYFFLQATKLLRNNGMSALLATNTIAQGDTREVGLDQIISGGWCIPRAIASRGWPGEAGVEVAHVWLRKGTWQGSYILGDVMVEGISPSLSTTGKTQGNPFRLIVNMNKSFIGSFVLGTGFILTPQEAQDLLSENLHNKDVLFPYLSGEDLNSRPDQSPSRWVINFHDWSIEKAEFYPECLNIVKQKVKPERQRKNSDGNYVLRKPLPDRWWMYADKRPGLYSTIANMKRVIVVTRVSKYMTCSWAETGITYSEQICVIASEAASDYTVIQSSFHLIWTFEYSSTFREGLRYAPSDCFETFPFPTNTDSLESTGERYYNHRQSIMLARQEGLTKTYNRFHNSNEHAPDIEQLRDLHKEMDEAVARAYGWEDLRLGHGFHETKQGLRWTISEEARREVLDRLLLLNHQRHAEEVAAGLVDESGKPLKGKTSSKKNSTGKARVVEATPVRSPESDLAQGNLF